MDGRLGGKQCGEEAGFCTREEFVTALTRREFDLYLGETTLTADFDLEALLAPAGSLNYGGYADEETTALLEACRSARGEERRQATEALCARVAEEVPILPICFKNGSLLTQWGQVSGAAPTQRDVFAGLETGGSIPPKAPFLTIF